MNGHINMIVMNKSRTIKALGGYIVQVFNLKFLPKYNSMGIFFERGKF